MSMGSGGKPLLGELVGVWKTAQAGSWKGAMSQKEDCCCYVFRMSERETTGERSRENS
jgi:hypothetical protein